jgi:hypothetical protein
MAREESNDWLKSRPPDRDEINNKRISRFISKGLDSDKTKTEYQNSKRGQF